MRDILKPTVTLLVVCLFVSVCLAATYSATKPTIDARAAVDAENARKSVLKDADSFKKIDGIQEVKSSKPGLEIILEAYKGSKGSATEGYVFATAPKGYGGAIEITVGIDNKGKVSGVNIGTNNETPGLGSKAKEQPFISQFSDLTPKGPLNVVKGKKSKPEEIEAISGATITSKAVTSAVQASIDMAAELAKKEGTKK